MIGNQSKLRLLINGVYKDIGGITDIPVFQKTRGELSRVTYKDGIQKRLIINEAGDLTITFNYLPKDNSQRIIENLFDDNKVGNWEFYLSDNFGTTKRFDGALKSHSTTTPNLGLVSTTVTISVSGEFNKLFSAVGLVNFINNTTSSITIQVGALVTKVTGGVQYSYRTIAKITVDPSKTIQGKVICLNAGTAGNTPSSVVLSNSIQGIHTTTNTELRGGGSVLVDDSVPDVASPDTNQILPGVTVSTASLSVNEDTSETYSVVLNTKPTGAVTITASNSNTDGVTVTMSLSFNTINWSTPQNISVYGKKDADQVNETATITHICSGSNYDGVAVSSVAVTIVDIVNI